MEFVKKNALGILICLVIAVPAWLLGQRFEVVGGPVFAILIGMAVSYTHLDVYKRQAYISYAFTEVATIYPITPSSPMADHVDEWAAAGMKNIFGQPVKLMELQAESRSEEHTSELQSQR